MIRASLLVPQSTLESQWLASRESSLSLSFFGALFTCDDQVQALLQSPCNHVAVSSLIGLSNAL